VIVARYIAIVVLSIMLIYFVHYSYTRINSGKMAVGMFVTIFMTMTQWFNTMGWLASNMKTIVIEYGIVSAYAKLLTHRSQNNMIAPMPTPPKTGLYLHKVSYYIQGRTMPILSGIDLHIHPNERIALIGSIGSGKTTLLKIIAHLKTPTHGHIYFNGHQLAATSVGYVPQTPTLFDRTLYENIVYGVDGVTTADIDAIISALGLTEAFDNLENGLNTVVGKNGSVLSGGQRQLVQLMRVMLMDPPILVLDEVTASLDVETKKKLFKVLDILMKDKTVIMVTHDEHLMSQATRIVKLDEGKLINVSNAANDKQERRMYQ
jgi:ABC-type multidrug transport system fused ATPase/permease subunit